MENPNLISISAVRSALKVIYTPAITLARPIGLRNDPHTATILQMGKDLQEEFQGAVTQMTPFERRDFEQWQSSTDGVAFNKWSERAFALAAALRLVEEAFVQDDEEEVEVDPTLQRMVDINWVFETHGQWLIIVAFVVGFVAFFSTGGLTGALASGIRFGAAVVTVVLVLAWIGTKLMPAAIAVRARKVGQDVPSLETASEENPLWEDRQFTSFAKIMNYANWVILAQPGANAFMELNAPVPVQPTEHHSARQEEILGLARRFLDKTTASDRTAQ